MTAMVETVRVHFVGGMVWDFKVFSSTFNAICKKIDAGEELISFCDVNDIYHCINLKNVLVIKHFGNDIFIPSINTMIKELSDVSEDDTRITRRSDIYFPVFVDHLTSTYSDPHGTMETIRWCPVYFYKSRSIIKYAFGYYYIPPKFLSQIKHKRDILM